MNEPAKKLPKSLILVLILLASVCVIILVNVREGFEVFNTFQPEIDGMESPPSPGYP